MATQPSGPTHGPLGHSLTGHESPPPENPHPTKRRREWRSSDECSGVMQLEQYIHQSDPYRYSTQNSPFPLPVLQKAMPDSHPDAPVIIMALPKLVEILSNNGITQGSYQIFPAIVSKPGYEAPMNESPSSYLETSIDLTVSVVRVFMDPQQTGGRTWPISAHQFREHLTQQGLINWHVEILNVKLAYQPSIFPLASSSDNIQAWERVSETVLAYLNQKLEDKWRAVSLWNVAPFYGSNTVSTLVVYVNTRTREDWSILEASIQAIIRREFSIFPESSLVWDVEFLPGGVSMNSSSPGKSFLRVLKPYPFTGASIGSRSQKGGGTLGGFVRLEVGQKVFNCVMTNDHVVRRDEHEIGNESLRLAEKNGCLFQDKLDKAKTKASFQYFATKDVTATKEDLEGEMGVYRPKLESLNIKIEMDPHHERTAERERQRDRILEAIKELEKKKEILDKMPMGIGKVLVSSGRHIGPLPDETVLDWALIELSGVKGLSDQRTLPPIRDEITEDQTPRAYDVARPYTPNTKEDISLSFGEIKKDGWYCKRGRTTDVTTGLCHGTGVFINWGDAQKREKVYNESGKEVDARDHGRYREAIILSRRSLIDKDENTTIMTKFSAPGDSGAFVFDVDGNVAGLLYGELTGRCGPPSLSSAPGYSKVASRTGWTADSNDAYELYDGAGLVTSIEHILSSVARHTDGGTLTLPPMP